MNINDIAILVEAIQAGSLAEAARRLQIAPMMASRRLAALEDELGVRLVHRTTRALALTGEGEAFFPYAQAMLETEAHARAAVHPSSCGASGLLRLTTSVPFGRKVVAPMIPGFMKANPEVKVDLLLSDSVIDIVGQSLDLAIRIAPLKDNGLVARKLADNPRALYASPAYVSAYGAPRLLADLSAHQCLAITGTRHWSFSTKGGVRRQRVAGHFSASSVDALRQACLGGLGITMLSDWDVNEDLAAGRLIALPLEDAQPELLKIWAVYPSAQLVPLKVRIFIEALKTSLETASGVPISPSLQLGHKVPTVP